MKIIVNILLLLACSIYTAKAQEVYNYVLNNATRTVNNPIANFTQTQLAQFKRTALVYLRDKARQESDTISSLFLDTQAYYLSEFVELYIEDVLKSRKMNNEERNKRILVFTDASISNPLFNDSDQDTTLSFIKSGGEEITPFSLDTDWEKAFYAAKSQIKK